MLVLAPAIAASGLLGGFGQFAFGHSHSLPAFDVSPTAFTAKAPNALKVTLSPERTGIVIEKMSRFGKTIALRPAGNAPVRMDYESTSLGFSLRYVNGMEWTAEGEAPPFITWSEGTVGPGVPAAAEGWALLTWRTERPPLLLVFSNPVSLRSERTDRGFIVSSPRWTGTVSVRLPFGKRSVSTAAAADFGKLLQELRPMLPMLTSPAPKPVDAAVKPHAEGYEISVRFDRPGTVVPPPAVNNPAVRLLSAIAEPGPAEMPTCATEELRFIVRAPGRMPAGIPFTYRAGAERLPSPSPENRVLSYMAGNCTAAEALALGALPAMSAKITEPFTNTPLPLAADGSGGYEAGLRALELMVQGREATMFDGLLAGLDWATWQPVGGADAAAMMALASLYSPSSEARALGAMANAGISVATGWDSVRNAVYGTTEKPEWLLAMQSPIRLLTPGVTAFDSANGVQIAGTRETVESFEVAIASDTPIEIVSSNNLSRSMIVGVGNVTTIRLWPERYGEWSLIFRRSSAGRPIPKSAPSPRYSAVQR